MSEEQRPQDVGQKGRKFQENNKHSNTSDWPEPKGERIQKAGGILEKEE